MSPTNAFNVLPQVQMPTERPEDAWLKGQQIRSAMDVNALAPERERALKTQNDINALALNQSMQGDSLKQIQTREALMKLKREGEQALLGPAKHIISVYEKDPDMANRLYDPLVQTANAYGVGASPKLNIDEMKSFVAGVEGSKKPEEVMNTPQLYSNPKTGKDEMWYFDKSGKAKSFVRNATKKDIHGEAGYDPVLWKQTVKDLPKLKEEATTQANSIKNIDDALSLIETGKVTGKGGALKAWMAPYAEAAGIKTEGMDDAARFKAMTNLIKGPMRLAIIGPGPVSNYEQQLLTEMGGGGGTAIEAARKLLKYYRQSAVSKVETYNQELQGASEMNPSSNIMKVHRPIKIIGGDNSGATVPSVTQPASSSRQQRKQGKDGNWYVNNGQGWRRE